MRHIGGSEALFIGRLRSEKLFYRVPLAPRVFTTPVFLFSSRFSLYLSLSLSLFLALALAGYLASLSPSGPTKGTTNAFCGASNWIAGPRELHSPHDGDSQPRYHHTTSTNESPVIP